MDRFTSLFSSRGDAAAASPSSPASPPPAAVAQAPSHAPLDDRQYDPEWYTWSKFFTIMSGSASQEDMARYIHARSVIDADKQCKRCEEWRDWLLDQSPTVIFLRQKINQLGGDIDKHNVHCRRCPTLHGKRVGAMGDDFGILLCQNHLRDRNHTEDVLAHEMVHAWDFLKFDWDKKDIRHAACSEIRATMLSGECRWAREFFQNYQFGFSGHFQECVRREAIRAVKKHPLAESEEHASKVVQAVWGSCFADTRPFDEIYR